MANQTVIALTIGLVVFLVISLFFTSTADAAVNFRCVLKFGKCATEPLEEETLPAPKEYIKKEVEVKRPNSDETQIVNRSEIPDMRGISGDETFALLVNKEWKLYPDLTDLIQGKQNTIEIIRRKNDTRQCRVTITVDNKLYREATPELETYGYTQDCESIFVLDFKKLKEVYESNPEGIDMDVIVFKPGVGEDGIGNVDKWAASVKMPIRITE